MRRTSAEDTQVTAARGGRSPTSSSSGERSIKENTPTRVMGLHLERSPEAVQAKANELGLSTKPTNQSPYGKRKK